MNEIKVSVVIPVYNAAPYIHQCLDSILNQTLREIEVICVNDGSKDNSLSILREYEAKDSRMRIISQQNAGVAHARNTGIYHAKGKYLSVLDADDFFDLTMLEQLTDKALYKPRDKTLRYSCISEYSCRYTFFSSLCKVFQPLRL